MTDLSKLATEEGLEVAPGVRVRLRSLADYRQNEENPVAHSPRNAQAVLDSIHRVGAGRSGFASKGKILAGNLTYEMMAEAGIEGVVEVTTDGKRWVMVNREDLTPEQEKQAAYRDQFGSMLSSWNVEQIAVDLEADMDIEGLWTGDELAELVAEWEAEEGAGDELEIVDVFDILWPSANEWDIPTLDIEMQAQNLVLPCVKWGTIPRRKNAKKMRGTWHFYTDDYKFNALWRDPTPVLYSGCVNVIEPNFSTNSQMPLAVGLWRIYRKRWLARWWQSKGIRIFVDLNVSPKFRELNLLGVPDDWQAYATRLCIDTQEEIEVDYATACERAGTDNILFLVYGGRGETAGEFVKSRGWLFVEEDSIAVRR